MYYYCCVFLCIIMYHYVYLQPLVNNNISSRAQITRFLLAGAHCCTILTMPLKVVGLEGGATGFPPPLSVVADEHGTNADKKSGRKRNDIAGFFFSPNGRVCAHVRTYTVPHLLRLGIWLGLGLEFGLGGPKLSIETNILAHFAVQSAISRS